MLFCYFCTELKSVNIKSIQKIENDASLALILILNSDIRPLYLLYMISPIKDTLTVLKSESDRVKVESKHYNDNVLSITDTKAEAEGLIKAMQIISKYM